jgi:DHA1 family tetracycline resistance protein-like MFS transporter
VFGWSTLVIGLTLSAYGMLMAVAQAVVMPRAVARLGETRLAIWGSGAGGRDLRGFGVREAAWMVLVFCRWRR